MGVVAATSLALIVLTTVGHYEVLRLLSFGLPRLRIRPRARVLMAMFCAFFAHGLEILVYGLACFVLGEYFGLGAVTGAAASVANYLYFSAETFTSVGFGDIVPSGPLRLLAGIETLNGLLLIGWSASYLYISMERFWVDGAGAVRSSRRARSPHPRRAEELR